MERFQTNKERREYRPTVDEQNGQGHFKGY